MPYIKQEDREKFKDIEFLFKVRPELNKLNAGELNYLISWILNRQLGLEPRYARINEIIGALECCKIELYRRKAADYEDKKAQENGDVYD
jgi:hypothetical protein